MTDHDEWGSQDEPLVKITCFNGPLSALAARLRQDPHTLMRKIRAVGGARGRKDWELEISNPTALFAARRMLERADADD